MIYEVVLPNLFCSLEFVFSLLLLQPFNFSPVSFACNFQDWGCVILREIDFLLKICWSIPCLHLSWKVHTWIEICASLNHRKKTKADGSRLIPRKHTETLVLLSVFLIDSHQKSKNFDWRIPSGKRAICSLDFPMYYFKKLGSRQRFLCNWYTDARQCNYKLKHACINIC